MQATEIIKDIIFMVGNIFSIVSYYEAQRRRYRKLKRQQQLLLASAPGKQSVSAPPTMMPAKVGFSHRLKNIFSAYKLSIIIFVVSVILVFMLDIVVPIVIPTSIEKTAPPYTPPATPYAPASTWTVDAWLDELDPIIAKDNAFFLTNWNSFEPVQVESTPYIHSIGARIPYDKLVELIQNAPVEEQEHSEYLEYRLSRRYKSLQFDYGIDDSSYSNEYASASMCEFKIVVQSCDSQTYLGKDDNVLFDSDWINYRCTKHPSPSIDVSGSEAIRITVFWKFYVHQDEPIAFNVAIVNPFLRAAKSGTMPSQPPS